MPAGIYSGIHTVPLRFDLAGSEDDEDLRRLLRDLPLEGRVSLSLEREPSVFAAATVGGDQHQILIGRDTKTGQVAGFGGRFEMDAYINGDVARLGYFGELRVLPRRRKSLGHVMVGAFGAMRKLHEQGSTPFYFTTIISDNRPARRLLEAGVRGMPTYQPFDRLLTFVIPTRKNRKKGSGKHSVLSGNKFSMRAIADHLQAHGQNHQLHPFWSKENLESNERCRGLALRDFLVVEQGGNIEGLLALWDQRDFKQSVVRGYAPGLSRMRPLFNVMAPIFGQPVLPPPGTRLENAFLSHVAVPHDREALLADLVADACVRAAARNIDYVSIALSARNPLAKSLEQTFSCYRYVAEVYLVYWPDGEATAQSISRTVSHLEVAII